MPTPVLGNQALTDRAGTLAAYLNVSHKLKLFVNALTVTPATPFASFVEASFTGYAAVDLAGQFTGPTKIQDGQFQITTPFYTFSCTGGAGQTVYGWWIDDGTSMKLAQTFDTPISITPGSPYTLQVQPQEISQSIL
jgi:hypothetical protein